MRFAILNLGRAGLCLAIWLCGALSASAQECEFVEDTCIYEGGTYQIRTPDVADPNYRIPVIVILHDAGRSGAAIINDERLMEAFVGKGYAVLAPDALPRRNVRFQYNIGKAGLLAKGTRKKFRLPRSKRRFIVTDIDGTVRRLRPGKDTGWYFYNVDQGVYSYGRFPRIDLLGRDEIQFLRDVLSKAAEDYGIDPNPVLIIGLGHGGSLVWQIACYTPKFGQILAPVGGAFWRKIPKNCKPGANLVHTHHRASAFWPLEGVERRKKRYARTSIHRNLEMLRRENNCGPDTATDRNDEFGVSHTTWADCTDGGPVEFMVLDDAFAFQTWWLDEMLGRIERTGIERPAEAPEVPLETGPGFKAPGTGTGFKTPGTGTGFKTPGTGTGSRFKRAK